MGEEPPWGLGLVLLKSPAGAPGTSGRGKETSSAPTVLTCHLLLGGCRCGPQSAHARVQGTAAH